MAKRRAGSPPESGTVAADRFRVLAEAYHVLGDPSRHDERQAWSAAGALEFLARDALAEDWSRLR